MSNCTSPLVQLIATVGEEPEVAELLKYELLDPVPSPSNATALVILFVGMLPVICTAGSTALPTDDTTVAPCVPVTLPANAPETLTAEVAKGTVPVTFAPVNPVNAEPLIAGRDEITVAPCVPVT